MVCRKKKNVRLRILSDNKRDTAPFSGPDRSTAGDSVATGMFNKTDTRDGPVTYDHGAVPVIGLIEHTGCHAVSHCATAWTGKRSSIPFIIG